MNNYDIYDMSIEETASALRKLVSEGDCDGTCDDESPHIPCDICGAKYALSRSKSILQGALKESVILRVYRHPIK